MSAITHQKNEVHREIIELMDEAYKLHTEEERHDLTIGLAGVVASGMTLKKLLEWRETIKESIQRRKGALTK